MLPLGTIAPNFNLLDSISGRKVSLKDEASEYGTVVMFICNHCPYVKFVQEEIVKLANDYIPQGIKFLAVSSNDVEEYPEDSPELMLAEAKK